MPDASSVLAIPIGALERMINKSRRKLRKLGRRRSRLQRKLDAVDRRIAAVGGAGKERRSTRASNEISLAEAIAKVLSRARKGLGVSKVAEKVQAAGYRSGSANFRGIVNQALVKDKRFVSEARGVYRLRGVSKRKGKRRR